MHVKQSNELCKKIRTAAAHYEKALLAGDVQQEEAIAKELETLKKEMRSNLMKAITEKVGKLYFITIVRSNSPRIFSEKILAEQKNLDSACATEFLKIISNALQNTARERLDSPHKRVGLYYKQGLSYSGEILQVALESYVISMLDHEQLKKINMFYLDFPSVNIKDAMDESSVLFREFSELLFKNEEITEDRVQHFDTKVKDYINCCYKDKDVGVMDDYSPQGQKSIAWRIQRNAAWYEAVTFFTPLVKKVLSIDSPEKENDQVEGKEKESTQALTQPTPSSWLWNSFLTVLNTAAQKVNEKENNNNSGPSSSAPK